MSPAKFGVEGLNDGAVEHHQRAPRLPLLALGGLGVRYLATIDDLQVDGSLYNEVTGPRDRATVERVASAVRSAPGVASASPPFISPKGDAALIQVQPATSPNVSSYQHSIISCARGGWQMASQSSALAVARSIRCPGGTTCGK